MFLTVGGELRFLDGGIVGLLLRERKAVGVHHEQVVRAGKDDRLPVGRRRGPPRPLRRLVVVVQQVDVRRRHVVLEMERPAFRGLRSASRTAGAPSLSLLRPNVPRRIRGTRRKILALLVLRALRAPVVLPRHLGPALRVGGHRPLRLGDLGVARNLHVELEGRVLLHELDRRERQMLRVVRLARDGCQRCRHPGMIEERPLRLLHRVHEVELAALARLVAVPEAVARLEPSRRHRRVEHEASDFLRCPVRREIVVRLRRGPGLRPRRREGRDQKHNGETPGKKAARHTEAPSGKAERRLL